jgi:DNA-binding transcriptional MerR regulator
MEIRIGDLAKRSGCEVVTIRYYGAAAKAGT